MGYTGKQFNNEIDESNSTTTALAANATFTGRAFDCTRFSTVSTTNNSDQDGTIFLEFSADGTNWDISKKIEIDASQAAGSPHMLAIVNKFFRVRYVNGTVAQGHLRIQTIFSDNRNMFLVSSPNQVVHQGIDVQLVRILGEPSLDASRGLNANISVFRKLGRNEAVGTTFEDLSADGGNHAGFLEAASAIRIASGGNAADDTAGTGARTVIIEGLDANFQPQTDTLVTAGTSASAATTNTYLRVNRATVDVAGVYASGSGTRGNNTGSMTIETTGGVELSTIPAILGRDTGIHYTVPANANAYVFSLSFQVDASKAIEFVAFTRHDSDDVTTPYPASHVLATAINVQGSLLLVFDPPAKLEGKSDFWVEVKASSGQSNGASAVLSLILVENDTGTTPSP